MITLARRIAEQPREGDELVLLGGLVRYVVVGDVLVQAFGGVVRVQRSETPPSGSSRLPSGPADLLLELDTWRDLARAACSWSEADA